MKTSPPLPSTNVWRLPTPSGSARRPSPSRAETKAIFDPSGDQLGCASSASLSVTRIAWPPPVGTTWMSRCPASSDVYGEGELSRRHLVQHASEAEEVGAVVDVEAERLLGAHVRDGAENEAGIGGGKD
ncbi:MAG: hypothetical protein LC732_07100, partial [Acidobacteria bacterium]|nr:hypothetical protein [Acidobacteriota bacterium]